MSLVRCSKCELLGKLRESPVLDTVLFSLRLSRDSHAERSAAHVAAGESGAINDQFAEAYALLLELLEAP